MPRLRVSGSSIVSPVRDEGELKRVVSDLGVDLSPAAVHELHVKLAVIIGQWMAEQQRLEVSSVSGALLSTARNLNEAAVTLGGFETGLHSGLEIAVATRIARYLAVVPGVSSLAEAQELISSFRHEATRIAHVCMVARADLPDRSERRQALDWYDDFTALLLELANQAADAWTRWKGRDRVRIGWLIEAARVAQLARRAISSELGSFCQKSHLIAGLIDLS